ncbi:MAG: hypothetical protein K8S18_19920 [Desulfobacula sp.]|nr:hypothetical protein [Desulfobacula sp.]
MIKHNVTDSVFSAYNPIISLKPEIRKKVNSEFLYPILESFFSNKGGINKYESFDVDKLRTDVEFNNKTNESESYVQSYIYKEVIQVIKKQINGKVKFIPKFVITFDNDLTPTYDRNCFYPYETVFDEETKNRLKLRLNEKYNWEIASRRIYYGTLKIGKGVILYHIGIELQRLIDFIKQVESIEQREDSALGKTQESSEQRRNRLIDNIIRDKTALIKENESDEIKNDIERLQQLKEQELEGESGILRVNLSWNTTDDLDLHIETPKGEVSYNNKTVENEGIIASLDVDANAGGNLTSTPQENIVWDGIPSGKHKIKVNFYSKKEKDEIHFTLSILSKFGDGRIYDKTINNIGTTLTIAEFEYVDKRLVINDLT